MTDCMEIVRWHFWTLAVFGALAILTAGVQTYRLDATMIRHRQELEQKDKDGIDELRQMIQDLNALEKRQKAWKEVG